MSHAAFQDACQKRWKRLLTLTKKALPPFAFSPTTLTKCLLLALGIDYVLIWLKNTRSETTYFFTVFIAVL